MRRSIGNSMSNFRSPEWSTQKDLYIKLKYSGTPLFWKMILISPSLCNIIYPIRNLNDCSDVRASVLNFEADGVMGKLLKYTIVLTLAWLVGLLYVMNEETFYTSQSKFDLFNSYLKRASDPHEKQLRLVETKRDILNRAKGKVALTTVKFVDEKYYLNAFSKTYKLLITKQAGIDIQDHDWIDAGLYLAIDYGVRTDHAIIFVLRRVGKHDASWNVLSSLLDNPVHCVRKKISKPFPDSM